MMTNGNDQTEKEKALRRICYLLEEHFKLTRSDTVPPEAVEEDECSVRKFFFRRKDTQVLEIQHARYIRPDVFVQDDEISCFGLIYAPDDNLRIGDGVDKVADWAMSCLREAAYLRHELLSHFRDASDKVPYGVEVMFITPGNQYLESLSCVLKQQMDRSTHLRSLGINVYVVPENVNLTKMEELLDGERRAFCWLLYETSRYFEKLSSNHVRGERVPDNRLLKRLESGNFRIRGKREWKLDMGNGVQGTALHLVQGANGSGKSSLVEALEFALTGRIERLHIQGGKLAKKGKYLETVKNRDAKPSEGVYVQTNGRKKVYVSEDSRGEQASGSMSASAFRLDQTLSDALNIGKPGERAALLQEAFFPDRAEHAATLKLQRERAKSALRDASEFCRSSLKSINERSLHDFVEVFGWVTPSSTNRKVPVPTSSNVEPTYILDEEFHWMAVVLFKEKLPRELQRFYNSQREVSEPGILFVQWQDVIRKISENAPKRVIEITAALQQLDRIRSSENLKADGSQDLIQSPETIVSNWLDMHAKLDLLSKQLDIYRTRMYLEETDPDAWDKVGLQEVPSGEDLKRRVEVLTEQVQKLKRDTEKASRVGKKAVEQYAQSSFVNKRSEIEGSDIDEISDGFEELNSVVEWLNIEWEGEETFSEFVLRGSKSHKRKVRTPDQTLLLGSREGVDLLRRYFERVRKGLHAMRNHKFDGDDALHIVNELLKVSKEYERAAGKSVADFSEKLLGLEKPLNELLACFTPARWAYSDVAFTVKTLEKDGEDAVAFECMENIQMFLQLNTAELNLFTMVMYLLCGPRRMDNYHRIIVLDDPFQNMDEMTVSAVARALARVLAIWKEQGFDQWRLAIFLHSADDVLRIQEENRCVVHRLPWLDAARGSASSTNEYSKTFSIRRLEFDGKPQGLKISAEKDLMSD